MQREAASPGRSTPPPLPPAVQAVEDEGFLGQLQARLTGEEGASYLLSLAVHSVILVTALLIPAVADMPINETVTTLLMGGGEGGELGDSLDTQLNLPAPAAQPQPELDTLLSPSLNGQATADFTPSVLAAIDQRAGSPGSGGGAGGGDGADGIRIPNPKNAVRVGNFTVWSWPISAKNLRGEVQHDPPGSAPRALQKYHIVIRVRVPENVRVVKVSDFTGSVTGTDGYMLTIPQQAFHYNAKGQLVNARASDTLRIIDGAVELLIEVPGAKIAEVQDTIKVVSQTLKEEQEIKLVFKSE